MRQSASNSTTKLSRSPKLLCFWQQSHSFYLFRTSLLNRNSIGSRLILEATCSVIYRTNLIAEIHRNLTGNVSFFRHSLCQKSSKMFNDLQVKSLVMQYSFQLSKGKCFCSFLRRKKTLRMTKNRNVFGFCCIFKNVFEHLLVFEGCKRFFYQFLSSKIPPRNTRATRIPLSCLTSKNKKGIFEEFVLEMSHSAEKSSARKTCFSQAETSYDSVGGAFEQLKVPERPTSRKLLKKGIFYDHKEISSVPQDPKVTKRLPLRLGKHFVYGKHQETKNCVNQEMFTSRPSGNLELPEKLKNFQCNCFGHIRCIKKTDEKPWL